jgi:hypothetical protein
MSGADDDDDAELIHIPIPASVPIPPILLCTRYQHIFFVWSTKALRWFCSARNPERVECRTLEYRFRSHEDNYDLVWWRTSVGDGARQGPVSKLILGTSSLPSLVFNMLAVWDCDMSDFFENIVRALLKNQEGPLSLWSLNAPAYVQPVAGVCFVREQNEDECMMLLPLSASKDTRQLLLRETCVDESLMPENFDPSHDMEPFWGDK